METYGDLKRTIKAISRKQKGEKIGKVIITNVISSVPGLGAAKTVYDLVKASFKKPDTVKTDSWLDKLDVDDHMSAIVDDTVENDFLKFISKEIEGESDDTKLDPNFNMSKKMQAHLKKQHSGRSVDGISSFNLAKEQKDPITKYLNSIAYKFPKGYPDMNNDEDVKLLMSLVENLVSENTILKESSEVYDATIKRALNVEEVPRSKNKYPFPGKGGSTFNITVKSDDMPTFKALYGVAPPKKGQSEGQTKGVGNGEIALYWLYNFSDSGVEVTEGRNGDDPDLYFNGIGVEVKAYGKPIIGLGRFGADKENLGLLSVIFGINALSKALGGEGTKRTVNPTNFRGSDLVPALQQVLDLEDIDDLPGLASKYPIFRTIQDNIAVVNNALSDPTNAVDAAIAMSFELLDSKLGRKPGDGGFLADVEGNGDIKFYGIDLKKLRTSDNLLDNFGSKQSSLYLNFGALFG